MFELVVPALPPLAPPALLPPVVPPPVPVAVPAVPPVVAFPAAPPDAELPPSLPQPGASARTNAIEPAVFLLMRISPRLYRPDLGKAGNRYEQACFELRSLTTSRIVEVDLAPGLVYFPVGA
jgi:hypothetical protein